MNEIDFDELDKAIQQAGVKSTPAPAKKEEPKVSAEPVEKAEKAAQLEPAEVDSSEIVNVKVKPKIKKAPVSSNGVYMDFVRKPAKLKVAKREEVVKSVAVPTKKKVAKKVAPKPAEPRFKVSSVEDLDVEREEPMLSPFVQDAKVPKRPLGSGLLAQKSPEEKVQKHETTPPRQEEVVPESIFAAEAEELPVAPKPKKVKKAPKQSKKESEDSGFIGHQQASNRVVDENKTADIYDINEYHAPLSHEKERAKWDWLWIILIVIILAVFGGLAAAAYIIFTE